MKRVLFIFATVCALVAVSAASARVNTPQPWYAHNNGHGQIVCDRGHQDAIAGPFSSHEACEAYAESHPLVAVCDDGEQLWFTNGISAFFYVLFHQETAYFGECETPVTPAAVPQDIDHGFLANNNRTQLLTVECSTWQHNLNPDGTVTLSDGTYRIPVGVKQADGSYKLFPAVPAGLVLKGTYVGGDFASTNPTVYNVNTSLVACTYPIAG